MPLHPNIIKKHYTQGGGYGHIYALVALQNERKELVRGLIKAAKPLSDDDKKHCFDAFWNKFITKEKMFDLDRARQVLDQAIGIIIPAARIPITPVRLTYAHVSRSSSDAIQTGQFCPTQHFEAVRISDPEMYAHYLDQGLEFIWQPGVTLRAHPIINGHRGFINPHTYCG